MVLRTLYLDRLRRPFPRGTVRVLSGVRRSGKTTLLDQLAGAFCPGGAVQGEYVRIGLMDEEGGSVRTPADLFALVAARLEGRRECTLFLDDADLVDGWERALGCLVRNFGVEAYVACTGRPVNLPAGRFVVFPVFPFSFREFSAAHPELAQGACWKRYLKLGGMPLVTSIGDEGLVMHALRDVCWSIGFQDIIWRKKVRDAGILADVIRYLARHSGRPMSANSLVRSLGAEGRRVSVGTALAYLKACEVSGLFRRIPRLDVAADRVMATGGKFFCADHGLRRAICGGTDPWRGHELEPIVGIELLRRGIETFAGQTACGEVSFVCGRGRERFYVQVSDRLSAPATASCRFNALRGVRDNYPKYIVSSDNSDLSRDGIIHRNIADFLCMPSYA